LTENELFNWNEVDSRLVELAKNISDFDSLYEHELEEISKEELASLNLI
jgi:hypothetical protein